MLRILQIISVFGQYGIDLLLPESAPRWVKSLLWCAAGFVRRQRHLPAPVRVRLALESLGPLFVKFGQLISTRRDMLSQEMLDELAKLQDAVPPFPGQQAIAQLESIYGQPIEQLFLSFEQTPLASASIAQVHAAVLPSGEAVVVKVLRPNLHAQVQRDVAVLYRLARLARRVLRDGHRLRPMELVEEYEAVLEAELDLRREAGNASNIRANFEGDTRLAVPKVYWPLVREQVLVEERIFAVSIKEIETLKAAGTNFKSLAENGTRIFLDQVFRDNLFHADMHPGNIFVDVSEPDCPRYNAVDFGIVGSLTREDQNYLAANVLAFMRRDYDAVAAYHIASGWVPKETSVTRFAAAIRSVCEPIFAQPIDQISFAQLLLQLFQTARAFQMPMQPQLLLLQKTIFNVEALGRQLDPELDIWAIARPYLERWIKERTSLKAIILTLKRKWPQLIELLEQI